MLLSDLSIRRPVLATVTSLLLIVCGIAAFLNLPLRELPDVDPPVVSVSTSYRGAAASVRTPILCTFSGAIRRTLPAPASPSYTGT